MTSFSSLPARALLALCIAASSPGALAADAKLEEAMAQGGLQKISVKGIELAFARPGAKLSAYDKVIVDPVNVTFARDWKPKKTGSSLSLPEEDKERIRSGVAKAVHEEFVRELSSKSTYQVVTSPGPGVLRVKPDIMNLYVSAPDTGGAARSRPYVSSAGRMTLLAELSDSASGEVQARVVDRREAPNNTRMTLSGSVENAAEAREIAAGWARTLRAALDRAHGIGGK